MSVQWLFASKSRLICVHARERISFLLFLFSLCAQHALEDMCNYLSDEGEVAIFDATNTTRQRRQLIYDYCTQTFCFRVFFVESICDSSEIINANIRVCSSKKRQREGMNETF